jgi:hypothetical protein
MIVANRNVPELTMSFSARFRGFTDWLRCRERRLAHERSSTFEPFPPALYRHRCRGGQKALDDFDRFVRAVDARHPVFTSMSGTITGIVSSATLDTGAAPDTDKGLDQVLVRRRREAPDIDRDPGAVRDLPARDLVLRADRGLAPLDRHQ